MASTLGKGGITYRQKETAPIAAAHEAKVDIRRRVLAEVSPARVFDAFAGEGLMWREVWRGADAYLGCDRKPGSDVTGDNRKLMRQVRLRDFTIFDFDCYGSPWEQMALLAELRPLERGELVGVVLTEGSFLQAKMGGVPKAMAAFAGIDPRGHHYARVYAQILEWALDGFVEGMRARVTRRWFARGSVTGARAIYVAVILRSS